MPAIDALTAKHTLTDDLDSPVMIDFMDFYMRSLKAKDQQINPQDWKGVLGEKMQRMNDGGRSLLMAWKVWLPQAEAFYVHPQMTELVTAAAESMPNEPLLPQDLPSPQGFVVIPGGLTSIDVRGKLVVCNAVLWSVFAGSAWIYLFTDKYDTTDPYNQEMAQKGSSVLPRYTLLHFTQIKFNESVPTTMGPQMLIPPEYGVTLDYVRGEDGALNMVISSDKGYSPEELQEVFQFGNYPDPTLRWIVAMWRLMQQPLTTIEKEIPPRQMRRLMERQNRPDKHVSVITLRRQSEHSRGEAEVNWSHRWLRRGHWRNQWYGTGADRYQRAIWIHPTICGPDDKPLLIREHIYSLER